MADIQTPSNMEKVLREILEELKKLNGSQLPKPMYDVKVSDITKTADLNQSRMGTVKINKGDVTIG